MKLFLQLIRPANGVTAISDVLAGAAIAGVALNAPMLDLGLLVVATFCLYSSGIIFNDVFDLDIDTIERPERALPSGKITPTVAITTGITLTIIGIGCSGLVNPICASIAAWIAIIALIYNKITKHHTILGPLTMGACRSLNLLLGLAILGSPTFLICLLPFLFVAAITITSKAEVTGNNKMAIATALGIDLLIGNCIIMLSILQVIQFWMVLPYLSLWLLMNIIAKLRAIQINEPKNIQKAVKTAVISLIPLNAVYAAGFGGWGAGLIVLALFPISIHLSKRFAVT